MIDQKEKAKAVAASREAIRHLEEGIKALNETMPDMGGADAEFDAALTMVKRAIDHAAMAWQ